MIRAVKSVLRWFHAKARNAANRVVRPAAVTRAQHEHVKKFPACAACGSTKDVQGHHIKPYHEFPELAADPGNFITLCEHVGGPEHHLHLGHGGSFRFWNPSVLRDVEATASARTQAERDAVVARAREGRIPNA